MEYTALLEKQILGRLKIDNPWWTEGRIPSYYQEMSPRLYIQSAYALPDKEKVDQEQASLLNVNDGFRKLIIVGDRYRSGYNEEGILIMSLSDFLLGKENKE